MVKGLRSSVNEQPSLLEPINRQRGTAVFFKVPVARIKNLLCYTQSQEITLDVGPRFMLDRRRELCLWSHVCGLGRQNPVTEFFQQEYAFHVCSIPQARMRHGGDSVFCDIRELVRKIEEKEARKNGNSQRYNGPSVRPPCRY